MGPLPKKVFTPGTSLSRQAAQEDQLQQEGELQEQVYRGGHEEGAEGCQEEDVPG